MLSLIKLLSASLALPLIQAVSAFDASSNSNVAVYWGQNSAGTQGRLRTYCDDNSIDIFLLSFLNDFPATPLGLNFANACGNTFPDGLLNCDQIAEDITYCQSKGKKVLLSLGGQAGTYGFTSDAQATAFAATLWNTFGEGTASERPFGTAVVDGFDLDIENKNPTGYTALVDALRTTYFPKGTKQYYISAAPQCPYPDASLSDVLANAYIDFVFVQFYNNYCSLAGTLFNWNTWANYAASVSPNKNVKIYVGLAGSSSAAGSGYVDVATVRSTVNSIGSSSAFGGVLIWDASQAQANNNFAASMKSILLANAKPSSTVTYKSAQITSNPGKDVTSIATFTTVNPDPSYFTSTNSDGHAVVYHYNTIYQTTWSTVYVTEA
ncbi:glycoside hydrolase family 18 protein [Babjeviella inositovora NRRL Y-12698]|uniref:chitinase n=1 Tax=Babjeviella inositovora NRRL Y-12698 TaxID=984486 RepID=A0A1E3QXT7_9ASCO|nr:glycoside hydrolase family 18 protein [Babjeviella inositovora NRRL Y-12698]ODQ81847.1 glycoside hydrolase family 18 protein [Babjeviella inositovora NRRL Y-12698]